MIKRHIIKSSLFAFLLFICFATIAQNNWNKRTAVGGSKRERGVCFSIGSRGFIGLGQDTLNLMLNDFWEFDPGTNSWTQKAAFPGSARRDAVAFSIGNKGYVGTGMNNADALLGTALSDFWEYNPTANTWSSITSFPGNSGSGVYYASGFSIGTKGYVCCGKEGMSNYSDELWEFNPSGNSWTQKASYTGGVRYGGVTFVLENMAYYGTGTNEDAFTKDFYKYSPTLNQWTQIASFPSSERFSCSSFTLKNKGYILFGTDGGYKDELWEYDPATDYWSSKASFPGGARRSGCSFTIGSRAYAGSGKGLTGTRRDFWEYSPSLIIGMDEIYANAISSIYPNPVIDFATVVLSDKIIFNNKNFTWELTDISRRIVQTDKVTNSTFSFRVNGMTSGIYFFYLKSNDKLIATKKLVLTN